MIIVSGTVFETWDEYYLETEPYRDPAMPPGFKEELMCERHQTIGCDCDDERMARAFALTDES